ncbi:histidine kinase [Actinocorallia sp. B10E7]|uniref:sensor histidine kinase n=1 Tax=Actinocorallia sp. B10E7 TaxID=3153558 RepID=UPI00325E7471
MPTERGTGLGGFRRYTWWSLAGTITLFLVLSVRGWGMDPRTPGWAALLGAAALAVLLPAVLVLLDRRLPRGTGGARPGRPPVMWLAAGCAAAAVLGLVPLVLLGHESWPLPPAVMVSVAATFLPPTRRRALVAAAVVSAAALGGAAGLLSGDAEWPFAAVFPAGTVAFTAWMTLGMLWAWDVADRLDAAGRLAAELAVKEERLRFAADLHDIQGHSLQVIALKSELAERLAATDPSRAAAEMREVRRLSADALRDTRAVAQGYRRTALRDEIANASKVLEAAEIRTSVERADGADARALSETGRHLLGLVMREATTNMLRHSSASRARISYRFEEGRALLRVGNDGADGASPPDAGTGLSALAERLRDAEGTLEWRREGGWFEVVASLPAGTAASAGAA